MSVVPIAEPARPGAAQRRYLTVFFSDLSDSTRLAAGMEAELYAELLDQVRDACRTAIARHGGTVVRLQGDGVLAIFGYPCAREDDARRATQAALDLHAAVRGLRVDGAPARLSLHTGIHSGLVLLDEGDLVRGRFELLGDAPNVAARLSDAAEQDEILVSAETLGPERHFFQVGSQRLLRLKGKAEPVAVCPVLGRAPVATRLAARAQRGLLPFVGRQGELERLERGLAEALAGGSRCLAVVAAAGLGKTRLADEFVQRAAARGCRILRGYCESYLGAEPLQPFVQMLRAVLGLDQAAPGAAAAQAVRDALARIDPALLAHQAELLRVLSIAAPESDADAPRRAEAGSPVGALCALFDRLARNGPMVVFVDDWQWADDASRQVLGAIRRLERPGVLVLIATRGFEAGDTDVRGAELIRLAPFDECEAAQTIDRLLPGTDPFLAAEIRRYAGGSPLFIEELCHFAAQPDADRRLGRPHGAAAWLDILIESRVARLPAAQAELVRTAAVIGNVIPAWLLQDLTGCAERDPAVQALAEQDFIFPGDKPGTLRFKHGITRDVVYDAVGLRQRRVLHLRIAESMRRRAAAGAQDEAHEALAYHYDAAGCAAEAAHHAELAGDRALAASALDRAQAQYRAALAALDRLPDSHARDARWHAIVQRLGMACVFDPSREQLDVFGRAVERAAARGDQAALAQAHYWLGYIRYALGESHAAIHHCQAALQGARRTGADDRLVVQMLATLGQARAAAGQYAGATALLDEAISIKRRHRTGAGPAVGFCYALACKASILGDQGLFEPAHACFDEALDALRGTGHEVEGSVLCWKSAVCLWQGRWDDALASARQAQRIGERVKSLYVFAMGRALGAYAEWNTQRAPASARAIMEATSWLEARGRELCISLNYGWLADVLVCEGRFVQARQRAACTLVRARRHDRLGEAMACRAMARAAAQGHGHRTEAHYLALAMRAAQARGSRHEAAATELCRAQLALARGDRAAAAAPLDRAQAAFEAMGMRWHLEQAERLRRA